MSVINQLFATIDYDRLILYTLFVAAGIQIFYYLFFYLRIIFKDKTNIENVKFPPISVIICAKNEAINLEKFLPKILEQNYPQYEVIVVNDCSHDETDYVLTLLKNKYKHLRSTTIHEDPKFKHGKKLALTVGIKSAKNEHIVLTDADCFPSSSNWLKYMAAKFEDNTQIVLGYGGFQPQKGFLDKLIRYDATVIAQTYLSYAKAGIPYMGVGRNLAYKKELFFNNKGFAKHYSLNSGDDDLFINEVATNKNCKIATNPDSFTRTVQQINFKKWFVQKQRHITTGYKYKFIHIFLLILEFITKILFYITSITYFTYKVDIYFEIVIGVIISKELIQLTIFKLTMNRLNEKNLLLYSFIFDIIQPIIYGLLNISNYAKKRRNGNKSKPVC
jgi:poly-beta-1,6-N-acetyl-D-glucosamine synthase